MKVATGGSPPITEKSEKVATGGSPLIPGKVKQVEVKLASESSAPSFLEREEVKVATGGPSFLEETSVSDNLLSSWL